MLELEPVFIFSSNFAHMIADKCHFKIVNFLCHMFVEITKYRLILRVTFNMYVSNLNYTFIELVIIRDRDYRLRGVTQ